MSARFWKKAMGALQSDRVFFPQRIKDQSEAFRATGYWMTKSQPILKEHPISTSGSRAIIMIQCRTHMTSDFQLGLPADALPRGIHFVHSH
jgi:hypothetical protein